MAARCPVCGMKLPKNTAFCPPHTITGENNQDAGYFEGCEKLSIENLSHEQLLKRVVLAQIHDAKVARMIGGAA